MVFCVSCGNQLLGPYCHHSGVEYSQSTSDAQSQVPVLTIPEGAAKKKDSLSKKRKSSKVSKSAARATSKSNGSAAGGINTAQASRHVPESGPCLLLSPHQRPQARRPWPSWRRKVARREGRGTRKTHAGPGKPPAKAYEATDGRAKRGEHEEEEMTGRPKEPVNKIYSRTTVTLL
jgi:hypothetical protein